MVSLSLQRGEMMKKLIPFLILLFLFCGEAIVQAETVGNTSQEGNASSSSKFYGYRVQAPENGTISSISVYIFRATSSSSKINVGLYNDNGGVVGTHIAHGTADAPSDYDDWYNINVSGAIVSGNWYWLVIQCEATSVYETYYENDGSNDTAYASSYTFDTWGDSPSLDYYEERLSIYATYTPASSTRRNIFIE